MGYGLPSLWPGTLAVAYQAATTGELFLAYIVSFQILKAVAKARHVIQSIRVCNQLLHSYAGKVCHLASATWRMTR
jgi:hypothetical protein